MSGPRASLYSNGGPQNQSEYGWSSPESDGMCIKGSSVSPDVVDGLQGSVDVDDALKSQSGCGWWAPVPN